VGDSCDYDDLDRDGVGNDVDNCPDVYNPTQSVGTGGRGVACDSASADADADTVIDRNDNCVLTPNLSQTDTDFASGGFMRPLGDACDGDCMGTCSGGANAGKPCVFTSGCPGGTCASRVCSTVDDDADVDAVRDGQDSCPVTANPTTVPGSNPPVQADGISTGWETPAIPPATTMRTGTAFPTTSPPVPSTPWPSPAGASPREDRDPRPRFPGSGREGECPGGPTVQACAGGTNAGRACTSNGECPGSLCATVSNACGDGDFFGDPGERSG